MKTPLFLLRIGRIPAEECELEETLQWQGGFFPDAMNNIRELVLLFLFQFLKCYCFGSTWLIFVCVFFCAWLLSVTWSTVFGLWSLLFAMNNIRECKCLLRSEFIYCNCCNGIRQRLSLHRTEYLIKTGSFIFKMYILSFIHHYSCISTIFFVEERLCWIVQWSYCVLRTRIQIENSHFTRIFWIWIKVRYAHMKLIRTFFSNTNFWTFPKIFRFWRLLAFFWSPMNQIRINNWLDLTGHWIWGAVIKLTYRV